MYISPLMTFHPLSVGTAKITLQIRTEKRLLIQINKRPVRYLFYRRTILHSDLLKLSPKQKRDIAELLLDMTVFLNDKNLRYKVMG